ncbi:signal peptidase I [Microbacterium sp. A8/3-1]|uniref:Signal peptidase I n=1 Tax=Microbacterium sp. A8/3-1 TaxID=3160749 RepID=A0AAU7VRL0_9MICO
MRAVLTFSGRTVAWVVILGASAVVLAAVLIPRVAGATPYTILTSSMSPAYPPGTLVVVRPAAVDELKVGDVVTVQLESGEETVVTHRISAISYALDGDVEFETKGDANTAPDRELRLPVQIRGMLWYSLPYLGFLANALTGTDRQWIVTVIAIGLLGYAAAMFVSAWRSRRGRQRLESAGPAAPDADEGKR